MKLSLRQILYDIAWVRYGHAPFESRRANWWWWWWLITKIESDFYVVLDETGLCADYLTKHQALEFAHHRHTLGHTTEVLSRQKFLQVKLIHAYGPMGNLCGAKAGFSAHPLDGSVNCQACQDVFAKEWHTHTITPSDAL